MKMSHVVYMYVMFYLTVGVWVKQKIVATLECDFKTFK